jgi:hypothetical protein
LRPKTTEYERVEPSTVRLLHDTSEIIEARRNAEANSAALKRLTKLKLTPKFASVTPGSEIGKRKPMTL